MKLCEKIAALRRRDGMTQEELAEMCEVSRQSVSKWESDPTVPELDKLLLLSRRFQVPVDVLLKEELELDQTVQTRLCGGNTKYLLSRIRETGFDAPLLAYMREGGLVVGVSAGSLLFSNHVPGHLELLDARLEVHCAQGERSGRLGVPPKPYLKLTNTCALVIRSVPDDMEIIGA